ncbi:MAG TPA: CAP domain-containing protein, partial [Longimicrobium sp.]|nr:CAP domain-containing protein [Longimicrobium sp.]
GQQPAQRLTARGVSWRMVAENIAWTPEQDARQTLQGWINSPGHRQNLENCAYTHHGIGLRDAYWTHVFVTPAATRP